MNRLLSRVSVSIFFCAVTTLCVWPMRYQEKAADNSCFANVNVEPVLVAFTTSKISKIAVWYKDIFGMEVVKEFAFPDGSVTGTLMRRGEFVVEVFRRDDAIAPVIVSPTSKQEQWAGVMKVGVYTDADLPSLKSCLKGKGVQAGRIFKDPLLNIDLLLVTDPEGNMVEVMSRHP